MIRNRDRSIYEQTSIIIQRDKQHHKHFIDRKHGGTEQIYIIQSNNRDQYDDMHGHKHEKRVVRRSKLYSRRGDGE